LSTKLVCFSLQHLDRDEGLQVHCHRTDSGLARPSPARNGTEWTVASEGTWVGPRQAANPNRATHILHHGPSQCWAAHLDPHRAHDGGRGLSSPNHFPLLPWRNCICNPSDHYSLVSRVSYFTPSVTRTRLGPHVSRVRYVLATDTAAIRRGYAYAPAEYQGKRKSRKNRYMGRTRICTIWPGRFFFFIFKKIKI
jgi:hypothetical protein